jgi:two-component system sensor histidine kinase ChvG
MSFIEGRHLRDHPSSEDGDVIPADACFAPDDGAQDAPHLRRHRRGFFLLSESPLTRKIITFNLIALSVLVAGILNLKASRESLITQRAHSLVGEVELIADVFEVQMPTGAPVNLLTGDGIDVARTLAGLNIQEGGI